MVLLETLGNIGAFIGNELIIIIQIFVFSQQKSLSEAHDFDTICSTQGSNLKTLLCCYIKVSPNGKYEIGYIEAKAVFNCSN